MHILFFIYSSLYDEELLAAVLRLSVRGVEGRGVELVVLGLQAH